MSRRVHTILCIFTPRVRSHLLIVLRKTLLRIPTRLLTLHTPPPRIKMPMIRNIPALDLVIIRQEQVIYLLQAQIARLRVAEVDDGHEGGEQESEDDVRAPADAVDEDGRQHDDGEVPDPVRGDAYGGAFCAGFEGENLWTPDPGDDVDGAAEDEHVEEEEGDGGGGGGLGVEA